MPEKAIDPLTTGMRLSPNDPYSFHPLGELAQAYHMLGEWDRGIENAERSLHMHPRYWYAHVVRICCMVGKDAHDEARSAMQQFMQQRPEFSESHIRWVPFIDSKWNEQMIERLRQAAADD